MANLMFTAQDRAQLRESLLESAARDARITGAAITGSAAAEKEDQWSDVDLVFGIADTATMQDVLSDWTTRMYGEHGAVHHMDVHAGPWIYRVFLLASTLQVDLAFVSASEFRALSPTFKLVFGKANEPGSFPAPSAADLIGYGWLYALHARSCIARGQLWQAEHMISGVRNNTLALACLRHGLPAIHGKGFDRLPAGVLARFEGALVRRLEPAELSRAFLVAVEGLVSEIQNADAELAGRLADPLAELHLTT
jgi:hypothetical protein